MKMYDTPQPLESYLNCKLSCDCGRVHYVPIKHVSIRPGALADLPIFIKEAGYENPFIICDNITYRVAGIRCAELLRSSGLAPVLHVLTHLNFDEATAGEIVIAMPPETDVIVAVGTGSITDIVRLLTARLKLPGMTVATGAPMDGFAASIGIVNVNGLKCTLPAKNTEVIIGDTDILQTAPYRMTVAGFGDLIGKLSCLCDWKLSALINSEHICGRIADLVESCVDTVLAEAEQIRTKDSGVLGNIMNGLVLSGVAISLYGNSRPASGAEHHMSHYWESIGDQREHEFAMHGEQVAVGTVLALRIAELLADAPVDFEFARRHARSFRHDAWKREIRRVYGAAADEVIDLEKHAQKNATVNVLKRIDSTEKHWDAAQSILAAQMSASHLCSLLKSTGCPSLPQDIGIDASLLRDTLIYSKEVRNRYTIMQLVYDLGLEEYIADKIIGELY